MVDDSGQRRGTPVWLWVLLGVGVAILMVGGFVARIDHHLVGIPVYVLGVAVIVTFVALRARITGRR